MFLPTFLPRGKICESIGYIGMFRLQASKLCDAEEQKEYHGSDGDSEILQLV